MRWIAYSSTEAGLGLYVRPFRISESGIPALGEGKWQVANGGNWPRWRSDKEIVFDNTPVGTGIFAASVKASRAVFESAVPQRLFLAPIPAGSPLGADLAPDGQRFLIAAPQIQRSAPASISVLLNWPAPLKK